MYSDFRDHFMVNANEPLEPNTFVAIGIQLLNARDRFVEGRML